MRVRHQRGSETIPTQAKNSRRLGGLCGKGEGARDVVRSAYFEGGDIREVKGDKGQGLGGEKGSEQGEVGQLHQEASNQSQQ
jgi:hypothetical protein